MEFDLDDEELSVLDYARRHGLCVPYDAGTLHFGSLPTLSNDDVDWDLCHLSNDSITNATNALTRGRLAVNKEAALLLKIVHDLRQAPAMKEVNVERRRWMLNLRQELPVLQTDAEFDMLNFGSVAIPDFKDLTRMVMRDSHGQQDTWLTQRNARSGSKLRNLPFQETSYFTFKIL
jgi:hypothetical protein